MTAYRIDTIMRRDIQILTSDTPIRTAVALLVEAKAAVAPVIDDGHLAGILSQKDCFRPALQASYYQEWTGRVADHMSPKVICVSSQDDVIRVAEMFLEHPYRVFPVQHEGAVAGVVHRSDVLALLARLG